MKIKLLLNLLTALLLACATASHAQTVPVSTTDMHTDTVNITPGMTEADIPFTVQTDESYIFQTIAPVNGVAMSVVSPSGAVFVPSSDAGAPITQENDTVVTEISANPSWATSLGNIMANYSTIKTGSNIYKLIDQTILLGR